MIALHLFPQDAQCRDFSVKKYMNGGLSKTLSQDPGLPEIALAEAHELQKAMVFFAGIWAGESVCRT